MNRKRITKKADRRGGLLLFCCKKGLAARGVHRRARKEMYQRGTNEKESYKYIVKPLA